MIARRYVALTLCLLLCAATTWALPPEAVSEPEHPEIFREGWIDFNKNGLKDVYEDPSQPVDRRVEDLLSQMTVNEKTCQLATLYGYQRVLSDDIPTARWENEIWKDGIGNIDEHLNGIPEWRGKPPSRYTSPASNHARAMNEVQRWFVEKTRLGVPADLTNEGIRGLCYTGATNFPAQVGVGATWNPGLARRIGEVTGREAAAVGYTNIYSPILDLSRDPRWGRVVECYGEDPFHVSRMGVAQAQGLQSAGIAATAKHFAVYSVPKGGRDGSARTDPQVSPRELHDLYLAPFEAAVREAGLLGVMSSYNDYDGTPVSASRELLTNQLRKRMGFRGYVVSDSSAVKDLQKKHRIAANYQDAVFRFLEAGGNVRTNFDPPRVFLKPLRELVRDGKLPEAMLDDRVRDVLRVKLTIGLLDDPFVSSPNEADRVVGCKKHAEVSLEAARQSLVLLKNDGALLPISKSIKSVLVCGPNAKSTGHSISRYGPVGGEVATVYDAVCSAVSAETKVTYAQGAEVIDEGWPTSELYGLGPSGRDAALITEAAAMAANAEVVVLVLGESEATIGESKSRTSLRLTGHQRALAQAIHATGTPTVAVLINGRALSINWIDDRIPAVLEAWFPGQSCGVAIAEALFGDYNPGGKLPVTFPKTVGQLPLAFPFKRGSHAGQGKGHNPNGVGHSRVTGTLYPFGHGLSYTAFEYSSLVVTPEKVGVGDEVAVACQITNTGDRMGDEVVQLYLSDDLSSLVTYESTLRGFQRIRLQPGESRNVSFTLSAKSMALSLTDGTQKVEPGTFTVRVGSSSEDIRLRGRFRVREGRSTSDHGPRPARR